MNKYTKIIHNMWEIQLNMFFHVLLLLNLVEELYCQNRNTTKLEILHEDRYSLQVGPSKKYVNSCLPNLYSFLVICVHITKKTIL